MLKVEARVINALMLREIKTRYGRQRLGYLWALLEPIMFVSVLAAIFTIMGRGANWKMPMIPFLITGIMPYLMFRNVMTVGLRAVRSNKQLLTFPQVSIFNVLFARFLLELTTHLLVFVILVVIALTFFSPMQIQEPLTVLAWLIVVGFFGFGLGVGFGALAAIVRTLEELVPTIFGRPMFLISGIFFTVEIMPEHIREIALFNPLLHMVELLRAGFFIEYDGAYASSAYAIFFVLAVLCLGMLILSALRKTILCLPPGV